MPKRTREVIPARRLLLAHLADCKASGFSESYIRRLTQIAKPRKARKSANGYGSGLFYREAAAGFVIIKPRKIIGLTNA